MWLRAEASPTSTTAETEDDYETVRERFYAEGWDEGRRRRRGAPAGGAFLRDWYHAETEGRTDGAKNDAVKPQEAESQEALRKPVETPAPIGRAAVKPSSPAKAARKPSRPHADDQARPTPQSDTRKVATKTPEESGVSETAPAASKETESKEAAPKETAQKENATGSEPLIRIDIPAAHVAVLTLNTPKIRNALTAEMRMALRGALKTLAADDRVHALIITGADGNFCAGGDVRSMGETDPYKIRQRMSEVAETAEAVASFPKPVIAAVAGHAAGAGVSLACLADIIVVDESAQFTFSFLRLALGPDWGLSWSLPRRVGATKARGLILARGTIDAREAQQIGLADHFASEGEVRFAAIELARQLCNGPREATAAVKKMLSDLDGLRAALNAEMAMQLERFPSWEHQEGAKAFKEKRAADYNPRKS